MVNNQQFNKVGKTCLIWWVYKFIYLLDNFHSFLLQSVLLLLYFSLKLKCIKKEVALLQCWWRIICYLLFLPYRCWVAPLEACTFILCNESRWWPMQSNDKEIFFQYSHSTMWRICVWRMWRKSESIWNSGRVQTKMYKR